MTTMKEVAQATGVSVSTVSLVLNNLDKGRVKPDTAERVRGQAKAMGYRSNALARSLRTSRTRILGFISQEVATTPFAGGLIMGAQDAAAKLGYMLITVSTDGVAQEERQIAALKRYGADGFLYAKMYDRVADVPASLAKLPVVVANASERTGHFPAVAPDEFQIGYDATRRLVEAGCERIAYIGDKDPILAQGLRFMGYKAALEEAGRVFDPALAVHVGFNQEALDAVEGLVRASEPDGFFCFNDARAWYVYEAAARRGLRVGADWSVVGVDNHRVFAETLAPRLTTIELPHYEMGYWAVYKLVSIIEGKTLEMDEAEAPGARAPLPALDVPSPALIHCRLVEKDSVASH
ncbi:LacI family transcriptional regulator [Bifidobacterium actinocoloniiforme DSM 22766]|uniref:LacI family transcriptional regulator n=1 Tax=Bifidobacterium actinocoloniiforme DSM 22766 TaxID=1437605 RepID=A0A086YZP0_9BIFI|nr:LacI family DNA-binding transcriptional regulator [Bifidobacterium actinocoloniiforme]AKV55046.1 LacI family transcriptional regulator [Bifidobacterium actinocoloniiforme DSM 22766]KFI39740.1 LacI family transcriptional regulator [Bifidobacterium actinocoloniiforme DSM 22766]